MRTCSPDSWRTPCASRSRAFWTRFPSLADNDFVLSRQLNLETIHDHDVLAERWGTVGELRSELAGGRSGRQTTLSEWLTS